MSNSSEGCEGITEILNKLFADETVYLTFHDAEEARSFYNMASVRKSRTMKYLRGLDLIGDERIVFKFALAAVELQPADAAYEVWAASFVTHKEPSFTILKLGATSE